MQYLENFICLSYQTMDFLFPEDNVITAGNSRGSLNYLGEELKTIDFDKAVVQLRFLRGPAAHIDYKKVRTTVILKNDGLMEDANHFALLTSADCKVTPVSLDTFSLFGQPYDGLHKAGILACSFYEEKIAYLIDLNVLLKKYFESGSTERR